MNWGQNDVFSAIFVTSTVLLQPACQTQLIESSLERGPKAPWRAWRRPCSAPDALRDQIRGLADDPAS